LYNQNIVLFSFVKIQSNYSFRTLQITGGKKQREERAALFAVRVHLPCSTSPFLPE
jgi:hypothetical protein